MTEPSIPTRRLRPAIEAALRVAREGEDADPVEPAPVLLRRYLRFARLPAPALEVARRVIDDDDDFRGRVVAAASADEVGEAGWLWLARPDGWQTRLGELVGVAERRRQDVSAEREERSAMKRIAELEEALRRADVAAAASASAAADARHELDAERARRRASERLVTELQATMARAAADAERDLAAERARFGAERDQAMAKLEAERRRAASVGTPGDAAPSGVAPPAAEPPVDWDELGRSIAAAASAIADATARIEAAKPGGFVAPKVRKPQPVGDTTAEGAVRHPVKLPGGVLDNGVEAADHLLRVANVVLLVDGYNISNALAPGQPLTEQRARLLDALRELQARTGVAIEVVFDGAQAHDPWVAGGRSPVHVRFSPPDVEADDVLVDLVAALPAARPVVLATSDRGLRDRVRRHGANLIGARQLLAAMRR